MLRRAVVNVVLMLLALMLAGAPLLAAEQELLPRLREDLDRVRVAMRRTSQERLELLAHLTGERAAEALRHDDEGAEFLAGWALAMEMTQVEAERGISRGEDLGEAISAVESACARAEESLRPLVERGPGHVDPVPDGLLAAEAMRDKARAVPGGMAGGDLPDGGSGWQPGGVAEARPEGQDGRY